ncbi:VOC family protein [Streptomyces anulatus]|uniref:VOC family protein n=1 Tax=Streptomyces anulatus TaxID=1892 RepID=UPI0020B771B4|nr:VOC family protein [Streptomyces anulatus]
MLTVLPIRYVADVAASRRFYTGLGLALRPDLSVDVWAHLSAGAGAVGIHDAAVSQGRPPGTTHRHAKNPAPPTGTLRTRHAQEAARPHPVRGGGGAAPPNPTARP